LIDRAIATAIDDPFELVVAADLDVLDPGHVLPERRTSLIIDPPDGRVPPLTPAAQRQLRDKAEHLRDHYAANPEDFRIGERCLMIGNVEGPPMLPMFYNNNVQIVHTPSTLLIVNEMIHDAGIIHLDRGEHLPSSIQQWKGDGIGYWDGDVLVVDTTNFSDQTSLRGSGSGLHVIERFSWLTLTLSVINSPLMIRRLFAHGQRTVPCPGPPRRCSSTAVTRETTR
jgi:hypothetical protein